MNRSVVVSGWGTLSASGVSRSDLARTLHSSTTNLSEVDRAAGYHRASGSRLAALTDEAALRSWLPPATGRRMGPSSKYSVAAAKMALEDAGATPGETEGAPTAVVLSTAYGSATVTEKILRQILLEGPAAVSPALFTESVANAPAAQVALAIGAKGGNLTVTGRQAGPLIALAKGAAMVAKGRAARALVGAVDEVNPLIHAILDRLGALARPAADGSEVARPFDRRRRGFLAADGATVIVLEDEEVVRRRGGRVIARCIAGGSGFDPEAPVTGWSDDPGPLCTSLRLLLQRAGLDLASIDRVVSGACGLWAGDRQEARVLRATWGSAPLPPVLAPKGVTGEHGAGLLGAAMLAVEGAPFGPTAGFSEPDPDLGLVPHDGRDLPPPSRVLVSSLAAGGSGAWIVLDRGES